MLLVPLRFAVSRPGGCLLCRGLPQATASIHQFGVRTSWLDVLAHARRQLLPQVPGPDERLPSNRMKAGTLPLGQRHGPVLHHAVAGLSFDY